MAKVKGPLMSMEASGAYGGTLVFGQWKGRQVVRQLVTPTNPKTATQETAKNRVRLAGTITKQMSATAQKLGANTKVDRDRVRDKSPAGQAWNGYFVETLIGPGGANYTAAQTAWNALAAADKTTWNTAASALVPAMTTTKQTTAGGVAGTTLTTGQAFYFMSYTLWKLGLGSQPTITPPTYA